MPDHAGHPSAPGPAQAGDADPESDLGAGVSGRVDQDRIEYGPAWGVQRVDTRLRLDRHLDAFGSVVEHAAPHRRCTGVGYLVEQSPPGELQHTAAQQGVGGERVGTVLTPIDDQGH